MSEGPRLIGEPGLTYGEPSAEAKAATREYDVPPSAMLQPQTVKDGSDRSEALRLTGPPVETIKLDAEIDATNQLEFPDQNPNTGNNPFT